MKQTKNALAIMKMSAESTSSMMLYYPNGTTLSNGRVKDKSYQVIFLPLLIVYIIFIFVSKQYSSLKDKILRILLLFG